MGKDSGGGGGGYEAPDSLKSTAIASGIDLICEGPIKGLVNEFKSVYINDTPLENADGTRNFPRVNIFPRYGTLTQAAILGISSSESETAVGQRISIGNGPVVRNIADADIDALRVTLSFPALAFVDTGSGDTTGTTVQLKFELQPNGGSYETLPLFYQSVGATWNAGGYWVSGVNAYRMNLAFRATVIWSSLDPAAAFVTFASQYRLQGSGTWLTHETRTIQANASNIGSDDFLANQIHDGTMMISYRGIPGGVYEFRIIQTGGNGSVIFGPGHLDVYSEGAELPLPADAFGYVETLTISGKAGSKYQRSIVIRPKEIGNGPWNLRVTRLTADSTSQFLQNESWWESYTAIQDEVLTYPNTALMGFSVDAKQFSSIPKRGYDLYLKIVKIPSNYNPVTKQYTGAWDGTFTTGWTDNPAWCFYDLVTNARYGLGGYIPEAMVDKWALYTIGQYCDALVPSGRKDSVTGNDILEPRFSLNALIFNRTQAYRVASDLASVFRGMAYWAAGSIVAVQDSPGDPVALFTPANVVGGMFNYAGTSKRARHTAALVTWNDPANLYKTAVEYVEDRPGIVRYGYNPVNLGAFGTTSQGQANRVGRWLLYTEQLETEVVSFRTGINAAYLRPGNVILVADPDRAGVRFGGRIASATTTAVTVDAPVTLVGGQTYSISVELADGTMETRGITNAAGTYAALDLATALSSAPDPNAVWIITASNVAPQTFKVLVLAEAGPGEVEVTALSHNPSKYGYVEQGLALGEPPVTVRPDADKVAPPANLLIAFEAYLVNPEIRNYRLNISWEKSPSQLVSEYVCEFRKANDNWIELMPESRALLHRNVDSMPAGDYEIRVCAVNTFGTRSAHVYGTITLSSVISAPPDVTNLRVVGGLDAATFNSPDCALEWDSVSSSNFPEAWLDGYSVEIRVGAVLRRTDFTKAPSYVYTYAKNLSDGSPPAGDFTVRVKAVGKDAQESVTATILNVGNPTASSPIVTAQYDTEDCILSWSPCQDPDFDRVTVNVYSDAGRTALVRTLDLGKSVSLLYTLAMNNEDNPGHGNPWSVYFRVVFTDLFGQTSQQDFTATNANPDLPVVTSITATLGNVCLVWDPVGSVNFAFVEIWRSLTNDSAAAQKVGETNGITFIDGTVSVGNVYYYWLRSRNSSGNVSGFDRSQNNGHQVTVSGVDLAEISSDLVTIDVVTSLPVDFANYPQGSMVLLLSDNKLYKSTGSSWDNKVSAGDIEGSIPAAQGGVEVVGSLPALPDAAYPIGCVVSFNDLLYRNTTTGWEASTPSAPTSPVPAKFGGVERVTANPPLPDVNYPEGSVVYNLTDQKLWKNRGSVWVGTADAENLVGSIPARLGGVEILLVALPSLPNTNYPVGCAVSYQGKLYRNVNDVWDSTYDVGPIDASQITTGYLNAARIQVGSLVGNMIAAATITGDRIVAGDIHAAQLAAEELITLSAQIRTAIINDAHINSLDAAKITTGYLNAARILAGSIATAHLAANSVDAGKIQAGIIAASHLRADTAVITNALQVGDNIIGNRSIIPDLAAEKITVGTLNAARIGAGSITATHIGTNKIIASAANIGDLTVDTLHVKDNAISAGASWYGGSGFTYITDAGGPYFQREIGRITVASTGGTRMNIFCGIQVGNYNSVIGVAFNYLMAKLNSDGSFNSWIIGIQGKSFCKVYTVENYFAWSIFDDKIMLGTDDSPLPTQTYVFYLLYDFGQSFAQPDCPLYTNANILAFNLKK